jgi:hypothetical protein
MAQERKPYTTLIELKLTNWYQERSDEIKEAIEETPPGYYYYSDNNEEYRCIGWSEPKGEETEIYVLLQRIIPGGTETIRVLPIYVLKEPIQDYDSTIGNGISELEQSINAAQAYSTYVTTQVADNNEVWVCRASSDGTLQYLLDLDLTRMKFPNLAHAISYLRSLGEEGSDADIMNQFIFENVYE